MNMAMGCSTGRNVTGNFNTFIGNKAGYYNTTGCCNIAAIGACAGMKNVTGCENTFIGAGVAKCATPTGRHNVFLPRNLCW